MTEEAPNPPVENAEDLDAALREVTDSRQGSTSRPHALSDQKANELAAGVRPTVVLLAGGVASGKTTLLTSMYERFGHGPIAGRRFAGSLTLPGFEARAQGIRPRARDGHGMPHTHRNAVPWLHLRVCSPHGRTQELLLGDFDGEIFDRVVEGKDDAKSVPALRRADHVLVVLDGDALADPRRRMRVKQRAMDLIRVLVDSDVVVCNEAFSLVLTKLDVVNSSPDAEQAAARAALAQIRAHLVESTGVTDLEVIETAAISSTIDLPLGHGVDDLFDLWERIPARAVTSDLGSADYQVPGTWFGRFNA